MYVRAQRMLGAARTSAYYAIALFIGAFLSFVFLREKLSGMYLTALAVMIAGTLLVVADTLIRNHAHLHRHTFTHTHTVVHEHDHNHYREEGGHDHHHSVKELEKEFGMIES